MRLEGFLEYIPGIYLSDDIVIKSILLLSLPLAAVVKLPTNQNYSSTALCCKLRICKAVLKGGNCVLLSPPPPPLSSV